MHRLTKGAPYNITGEKQEAQLSHRGRAMPSAGARLLEQGGHGQFLGAHGEHVEREPITGVWGQRPQRGPRAEPLVRGSGGEVPLKLKAFFALGRATDRANLYPLQYFQQSTTIR